MSNNQIYKNIGDDLLINGTWATNARTGASVLEVFDKQIKGVCNMDGTDAPVNMHRKSFIKTAILEFVCYLRGYNNVEQFRKMGVHTWDGNYNDAYNRDPELWTDGYMGRIYGVQLRDWRNSDGQPTDQLLEVIKALRNGSTDRGLITTFWNAGELDYGILRPCMHSHNFRLRDGKLSVTSHSRSMDWPLGGNFNVVQSWFYLWFMSGVCNVESDGFTILIDNLHLYQNQLSDYITEMNHDVSGYTTPTINLGRWMDLRGDDLLEAVMTDELSDIDITLEGYEHGPAIKYPFTA